MCVARTARRQAAMGYTHIARLGRPIYRAAVAFVRALAAINGEAKR